MSLFSVLSVHQTEGLGLLPLLPLLPDLLLIIRGLTDPAPAGQAALPPLAVHLGHRSEGEKEVQYSVDTLKWVFNFALSTLA